MKTVSFEDRDEWLAARKTKITGSRLKDIYGVRKERKQGFWELLAERLEVGDDQSDNPMQRGSDLESDAIKMFEKAELVDCIRLPNGKDVFENTEVGGDILVLRRK